MTRWRRLTWPSTFGNSAVELAGSTDPLSVRAALANGIEFDAPGGTVSLNPRNQHLTKHCRVGRIRQIDSSISSMKHRVSLRADPFPQDAFPGWRCDWTDDGLVKGEPVSIEP